MENQTGVTKTNDNQTSITLQSVLQMTSVQLMQKNEFRHASNAMSTKIEGTFDEPKVREVIQAIGEDAVLLYVRFELIHLAALMSVGGNLNDAQVKFIAKQLCDMYPNETLADFKICFQRGAIGLYGDIQRMDGITIGGWMKSYLDEKYQVLEDMLMKEKDKPYYAYILASHEKIGYAPIKDGLPAPPEVAQKYIDEMKEMLSTRVNVPGMTDDEIKKNGKETPPKKRGSSYDHTNESQYSPKQLEMIRRQQIKDEFGSLPEEKIMEILTKVITEKE